MLEVTLLRLVGTGLVAIAPTFLRQASTNSQTLALLQTAHVPGDELIARLTKDAPERMTSFVESAVRRLWEANRDRLGDIAADVHAKHLISLLEDQPVSADTICASANAVRTARKKRDLIAQEARRLASAVLTHAGGGSELRQQGRDPLAVLTLADSLFTIMLAELPFLDDILPLIVAALADEPPLPAPVGQFASSLDESIASDRHFLTIADSIRRYAATQLVEARNRLADYCFMDGAQAEAVQDVLQHLESGARFRAERALNEIESRHLQTITSNLASSEREAPLAAAVRTARASMSAMMGDFDRAIRSFESAQRHVRIFGIESRWPVILLHARKLRDRATFTNQHQYYSEALNLIRGAVAELPQEGSDHQIADAALLTAEIAIADRTTGHAVNRLRFAIERAAQARATFQALGRQEDELAARHVEASARRLVGTLIDDGGELASAAELYDAVIAALDPNEEQEWNDPISCSARRADSIRGAWCVLAHLAVLAEDDNALGLLGSTPGGAAALVGPLAFCTVHDQRAARLRAETLAALQQDAHSNLQAVARKLETGIGELPEPEMRIERALLSDQLGTLHMQIAMDTDPPRQSIEAATKFKSAALDTFRSIGHPRVSGIAGELQSQQEALRDELAVSSPPAQA